MQEQGIQSKYEQEEQQDHEYTTVEGGSEELDREGDQKHENYDTKGGRDFDFNFFFNAEECGI